MGIQMKSYSITPRRTANNAGQVENTNIGEAHVKADSRIPALVGGTGKYASTTGTALLEVVMSQGNMAAVRWVGNCQ